MRQIDRLKILLSDRLRFNKAACRCVSRAIELRETLRRPTNSIEIARSIKNLAKAGRGGFGLRDLRRLELKIQQLMRSWSPADFGWDEFFRGTQSSCIGKSIILKKPQSVREKGVLFVAFETHWIRLFRHADLEALARDYDLVLSPTWSPPYDLAFFIASQMWPNDLFTILSNFGDVPTFRRISPRVRPIPLLASSWVNPELLLSNGEPEKLFDIVMLANFSKYKRHFALFQALSRIDRRVKALLLGVSWEGRSLQTLENEAELFGVRDRIVIKEALPDAEMFQALRSAKVSVIMSLQEGSCVAVTESLFAGVPVGLLDSARIGSRAFINDQTGRLLRSAALAEDLADFVKHYGHYQPRRWALNNGISCHESAAYLNNYLKKTAFERGQSWTVDIAPMHWRPYGKFLSPQQETCMREEYRRFNFAYRVTIDL